VTDSHEVYPSAPLALVAMEVRFPNASEGPSLPMPVQRAFRDLLGEGWVIEAVQAQRLSLSFGPGGAAAPPAPIQTLTLPRFTVRDRTTAVAVTDASLTVETTAYRHYPDFRAVVETALTAASEVIRPEGVARVGLRYIDEIRVPDISSEGDAAVWGAWLDPSLMPPRLSEMVSQGFPSPRWEGAAQYVTGENQTMVLRYGPRMGYLVNPVGPLKRPQAPPPGPIFVLDFDCFWEPTDIPEFEVGGLLTTCDQLRAPIRHLFDLLVTDKLLEEFKKERANG
jgi:uncharacterized protein (TIGR04255 family)